MVTVEQEKTEKLIGLVKNHSILYDKSHACYKDNGAKNKIWSDIAEIIEEGGDGNAVKAKWKNLRDAYIKYLRCNKPNSGLGLKYKQYKSWPWAKHVSFLRPYIDLSSGRTLVVRDPLRGTESTQPSSPTESTSHEFGEVTLVESHATPHGAQPHQTPSNQATQNATPQDKRTTATPAAESQVDKVIEYLNKKRKEYDDIDLIFLGYAKTVKKMTKNRQATVKFQIAKIIMESELEESADADASSVMIDVKPLHDSENNSFYFPNS